MNANQAVARQRAFAIQQHARRVASDVTVTELAANIEELIIILDDDLNAVASVDAGAASAVRDIVKLFKDVFMGLHNHLLQREAVTSKDFDDFSKSLTWHS